MSEQRSKAEEAAELYKALGSVRAVARALGIDRSSAQARLRTAKKRGLLSESKFIMPEGMSLRGVTALVDAEGRIKHQYFLARQDSSNALAELKVFADGLRDDLPRAPPVEPPQITQTDLLTQYTLTDLHFGMLAWGEETRGADYDLGIAENLLVRWFDLAIALAPPSEVAIFAQLGDFLHYDSLKAITPEHGNLLDVDSRFQKVVRVAIRVVRRIVAQLLQKHQIVHIKWCSANHDLASSAIFRELLTAHYENEPRVSVDCSPSEYYAYEWGRTALFYHHGHRRKPHDVDRIFAATFSELFGRSEHRYAHMGHKHEDRIEETQLMRVEQHRTLAPPDAFAASGGWISGRDAKITTYSKKWGKVSESTISAKMAGSELDDR